jgi:hypothetical protein
MYWAMIKFREDWLIYLICVGLIATSVIQTVRLSKLEAELAPYNRAKGLLTDPKIRNIMCVKGTHGK